MTKREELLGFAERVENGEMSSVNDDEGFRLVQWYEDYFGLSTWAPGVRDRSMIMIHAQNSLDAAQKPHDELLPDKGKIVSYASIVTSTLESDTVVDVFWNSNQYTGRSDKAPAAAWVAAILRALASMENDDD